MAERAIKTRVQQKHDFEVNWIKAINFIPLKGEIVFYDAEVDYNGNILIAEYPEGRSSPIDYIRIKVGNGINTINELPFELTATAAQSNWEQDDSNAADYIKNKPTILSEQDVKNTISNEITFLVEEVETKITSPTTAEVGQMLIVKAVNENGKPTEWETIDRSLGTPTLLGDVNGDGLVDQKDLDVLQRYCIGMLEPGETFIEANADVNGNGRIDSGDAVLINQMIESATNKTETLTQKEYDEQLLSGKIVATTRYYIV